MVMLGNKRAGQNLPELILLHSLLFTEMGSEAQIEMDQLAQVGDRSRMGILIF